MLQAIGEKGDAGNGVVGQVVHRTKTVTDGIDGVESMGHGEQPTSTLDHPVKMKPQAIPAEPPRRVVVIPAGRPFPSNIGLLWTGA